MILDLTIGFNELDLFRIRYDELKDIVDKFIIVEAHCTHSGKPKPLYFSEWAARLGDDDIDADIDWDKIEIFVWDNTGYPNDNAGAWLRENIQRELLLNAVQDYPDTTLVMLSDMDEIPNADSLRQWLHAVSENLVDINGVWRFEQTLSYLYMNTTAGKWNGTKIFPLELPRSSASQRPMTDEIRYRPEHGIAGTILNGGWHFSSCGGFNAVRMKFNSYAHTEMQLKTDDDINDSLARLVDPFNKNPLTVTDVNTLPQYVQENIVYFKKQGYIV